MMYSGDEFYDDDVTSGVAPITPVRVPVGADGPDAPRVASSTVTASAANPRRTPRAGDPPFGSGDRTIEGVLLLNLMEERLRELWRQHRWYQAHLGWIIESEMENRAELRFVLRFLRKARKDAMRVPDPLTTWKGWNE